MAELSLYLRTQSHFVFALGHSSRRELPHSLPPQRTFQNEESGERSALQMAVAGPYETKLVNEYSSEVIQVNNFD